MISICSCMGVEVVSKQELCEILERVASELSEVKSLQRQIFDKLNAIKPGGRVMAEYIPAQDFMDAVNIKRWKFDQLLAANSIKAIKKKRKIYVLATEVSRYFMDPSIE